MHVSSLTFVDFSSKVFLVTSVPLILSSLHLSMTPWYFLGTKHKTRKQMEEKLLFINTIFSNFYPQSLYIDGSPYFSSIHLSSLKFLSYENLHSLTKLTCLIKLQAWNTSMFSALMDSSSMTKEIISLLHFLHWTIRKGFSNLIGLLKLH